MVEVGIESGESVQADPRACANQIPRAYPMTKSTNSSILNSSVLPDNRNIDKRNCQGEVKD